ncbi:hypothetical protein AY599_22285 [Leptolyngbya valderiana BDU 20041]|nr:hypothetical protein AY599_22285 [Leptolyngbya valderiana BDU 20041]
MKQVVVKIYRNTININYKKAKNLNRQSFAFLMNMPILWQIKKWQKLLNIRLNDWAQWQELLEFT